MEDPGGAFFHYNTIWTIALLVFAAAFAAFLDAALDCCGKSKVRALAEGGGEKAAKKYGKLLEILEKKDAYKTALRIAVVFFLLLAGCLCGAGLDGFLAGLGFDAEGAAVPALFIAALAVLVLFVIPGEVLPGAAAAISPEASAALFLPVIKAIYILTFPLASPAALLSGLVRKLSFPHNLPDAGSGMTEEELHMALLEGEKSGIVETQERTMVEGVFYLGDRPVGVFMVHRSELQWLDIGADRGEAKKIIAEAGGQRYFPVVSGNLDQVAGMVSAEAILKAMLIEEWPGLAPVMKTPYFVPETMPAIKAFEAFKKAEADCLFVMDEYGGFAGLLTVRNLIEEIVGELSAPVSKAEEITLREDGSWLAGGSVNIDDAAQALELDGLGEGQSEYHTLAGFVLNLAGEIPKPGARFEYKGYSFEIVEMDGNRIEKISIRR